LVYSTDPERNKKCDRCKNLIEECQCKTPDEWCPVNIRVRMRSETSGRSGKTVTVIGGFPNNEQELRQLTKLLKNRCGSGGTFRIDTETGVAQVEIQGDKKDLIKEICRLGSKTDSIIVDFFAGSGTTAHAVLDLNKEDHGARKFLLIQLPENTEREDFKTIADIGKERIRRVIKTIEEEQAAKAADPQMKLPGVDDEQPPLDLGFKVFKLDKSNFRIWDGTDPNMPLEKLEEQLSLHVDHIDPNAGQEDILYELLLKAGFMPTEKVESIKIAGKTVFSIADGALLICLEDEITRELIDAVAEAEPMQFICLDRGFKGNDQLKANAVQTFAARNQGREKEKQIVFRTV